MSDDPEHSGLTKSSWNNLYAPYRGDGREFLFRRYDHHGMGWSRLNSLLTNCDRVHLLLRIIETPAKLGGAGLQLNALRANAETSLLAHYSTHRNKKKKALAAIWFPSWWMWNALFHQPFDAIRDYLLVMHNCCAFCVRDVRHTICNAH